MSDNVEDKVTPQYQHIKELSQLKYETEEKREQSLIQQASQMQTVFSFITAAVFMAVFTQEDDGKQHTITDELTEFSVPANGKAWIHPYDWNERHKPSYEQYSKNGIAINTEASHGRGWAFPMLFNTNDCWMMITEAYLDGSYPATHIDNSGKNKAYKIRFPEIEEPVVPDAVEPVSTFPWYRTDYQ